MTANHYGTEAYEMSLFEPKQAEIVELKPNKKQLKAQRRRAKIQKILNIVVAAVVSAVVIGVVGVTLTSRAQLNEMNSVINEKQEELKTLQEEYKRLKSDLDQKTSAQAVEDYAENVLGMQKIESNQIQYITVEDSDKVEVNETEDTGVLQKIGGAISDFFAYLF